MHLTPSDPRYERNLQWLERQPRWEKKTVSGYHIEWTVVTPLRGDDLDAAIEAILDGLAAFDNPDGMHDVDCGATLTTGTVEFCGYMAASSVDEAYRGFTAAVRNVIKNWTVPVKRTVHIEVPSPPLRTPGQHG